MPNPFDDVVPIGRVESRVPRSGEAEASEVGHETAPRISGSTNRLRDMRREVRRAEQAGRDGEPNPRTNRVEIPRLGSRPRSATTRRVLSFKQLEGMASHIAEIAYNDVKSLPKSGDRKHAATSFAIVTDKLLLLRGRPTEILGVTDDVRPASHDLAGKLAVVKRPA